MHLRILFFLSIMAINANALTVDTISIRNFNSGVSISDTWKYKTGDNRIWAAANFNDSDWRDVPNDSSGADTSVSKYSGMMWLRANFVIDRSISTIPLTMELDTYGACEVFYDGKKIGSIGKIGVNKANHTSGFSVKPHSIPLPYSVSGLHTIAVRLESYTQKFRIGLVNTSTISNGVDLDIISTAKALEEAADKSELTIPLFFTGVFLVLSIFHLILFLYYRRGRSNLYYGLFTLLMFFIFYGVWRVLAGEDLETTKTIITIEGLAVFLVPLAFIAILYEVFYKRLLKFFWILSAATAVSLILMYVFDKHALGGIITACTFFTVFVESIRVFIRAWKKKREGARIFIFGLLFPVIGLIAITIFCWILQMAGFPDSADKLESHEGEFFGYSLLMSVSLSMTIYLARDFSRMNQKLQSQLREIKQLFDRTVQQEKDRKQILENQNEQLEKMVTVRTEEVLRQKAVIEIKNRDILDNLHYARRIQDAILPEIKLIYETLNESFIIYLPKDIVSGDFYSFAQKNGKVIIAAADCTGHGVTGAFMSMIGSSLINQIVNERGITQPSLILNNLNTGIAEALKQNEKDINDGMDIAVCAFDLQQMNVQFAGANRPLWIFRNGSVEDIRPDKFAIGGFRVKHETTFTNHEISLQKGDTIYIFSDGFADQFGGEFGKKMMSKRFRETLLSIQNMPINDQEKFLLKVFNDWKGNSIQVDDVLVIGIRV